MRRDPNLGTGGAVAHQVPKPSTVVAFSARGYWEKSDRRLVQVDIRRTTVDVPGDSWVCCCRAPDGVL